MAPERARTFANVLLVSGAAVTAYVLLSRRDVRRIVWTLARPYLSQLPAQLRQEIADAWVQSGRAS
jgi:hypothetical protein